MSGLALGPLVLPLQPLVFGLAAAIGLAMGRRVGRRGGVDAEPALWRMLLLGLVAARLGFVWEWRSLYLHAPLGILDIRDGGWEAVAGFAAACLYGLALLRRQPALRKPVMAATMALVTSWGAGAVAVAMLSADAGEPLPSLVLPSLDGGQVALDSFAGKPTVVNLWAAWCPPCRQEMPLLQQAQATHPEWHVVFVNQGESRDEVMRYLQGQGFMLRNVLFDRRRAVGAAFNEQALPTTLFFDARGRLVSVRVGALSAATLAQRLQAAQDTGQAQGRGPSDPR